MGFLHMPKELNDLSDWVLSHWYLVRKSFPHKCGRGALGRPRSEGGVGEAGPNQMKMWSSPGLMVTSHTKLRTPDHFNSNTHWWKRRSRSKFASHYAWGTNGVCECKMDVTSTWDSYMTLNGSSFMVTRTIFINHLLEVGVIWNHKTISLQTLTTIDLLYFIMVEDPHEWKFIEISFGWAPGDIWLHTTVEDQWPHYMILDMPWDGLWTLSFGLPKFHGHNSWLVCEVALTAHTPRNIDLDQICPKTSMILVLTQMQAWAWGRPGSEGGVGGVGPIQMNMWYSPGLIAHTSRSKC